MIVGSYYCSRTDNQHPACYYPTSHYPSGTMGYCNNLLFSKFPGRCQFFLEGFRASQKHSFSPFVCLNHMIVHKYMINTEPYLTFWKYVDKLLSQKNLDKSANMSMNSPTNHQSFQLTAHLMLQSTPIPTKIDFYQIFLNIMLRKFLKVFGFKKHFEKRVLSFSLYVSKEIQKLFIYSFSTFLYFKKIEKVFTCLLSIFLRIPVYLLTYQFFITDWETIFCFYFFIFHFSFFFYYIVKKKQLFFIA